MSGTDTGAADATSNPSANNSVMSLALDSSGNVYAGGYFSSISSDGSGNVYIGSDFSLVKLSGTGTGTEDPNWNPSPDSSVYAVAIDGGGNVYLGGDFGNIGERARSYIAKLSGTGTGAADANWNPSADAYVGSLALDGSGNIYAGGFFTSIGGQSRNSIAKLSAAGTGTADPTWNPSALGSTAGLWPISGLAVDNNGNVYAAGNFTSIGGQPRNNIAKLSGTGAGAADPNWNPSANDGVYSLVLDGNGNVYAGGSFTSINGLARSGVVLLPLVNSSVTGTTSGGASANASFVGSGDICAFANAQFIDVSSVSTATPTGLTFPQGLFQFTTTSCTVGGTITLTLTYSQSLPVGSVYMKYGPTLDNTTPHWYQYPATIRGNTVVIQLTDGGAGDNDMTANGSISDPGGPALPAAAAGFVPLNPARLLDTRSGATTVDGQFAGTGAVPAGGLVDLTVTGRGNVPASGVVAIVLNVTVTAPTAPGYITAWPSGTPQPLASNLNFVAGETIPNLVIVKVGTNGKVSLYNSAGSTDLIADVAGYFGAGTDFHALSPARLLDTRIGTGTIDGLFQGIGALAPAGTLNLPVSGRDGIPQVGVGAAILNVTSVTPTAPGYLTLWPSDAAKPLASNLNFVRGDVVPNLVISKVSAAGQVSIYNSAGNTDVVADVAGWFPTTSQLTPVVPARLMDTRAGGQTIDGQFAGTGALLSNSSTSLTVLNRGNVPAVALAL